MLFPQRSHVGKNNNTRTNTPLFAFPNLTVESIFFFQISNLKVLFKAPHFKYFSQIIQAAEFFTRGELRTINRDSKKRKIRWTNQSPSLMTF